MGFCNIINAAMKIIANESLPTTARLSPGYMPGFQVKFYNMKLTNCYYLMPNSFHNTLSLAVFKRVQGGSPSLT